MNNNMFSTNAEPITKTIIAVDNQISTATETAFDKTYKRILNKEQQTITSEIKCHIETSIEYIIKDKFQRDVKFRMTITRRFNFIIKLTSRKLSIEDRELLSNNQSLVSIKNITGKNSLIIPHKWQPFYTPLPVLAKGALLLDYTIKTTTAQLNELILIVCMHVDFPGRSISHFLP
jgi:hypothetical protein